MLGWLKRKPDPVDAYVSERVQAFEGSTIRYIDLDRDYLAWCRSRGTEPANWDRLARALRRAGIGLQVIGGDTRCIHAVLRETDPTAPFPTLEEVLDQEG